MPTLPLRATKLPGPAGLMPIGKHWNESAIY